MVKDQKLNPECCGCASTSNLYGSNCKHLTICFNCGKSMAEKKQKCSVCGTPLTRLLREYNVRASSEKDNKYFIAKFANGLPDFNNADTWSHRSDLNHRGMLKILKGVNGKFQYEGRRQVSELSSYYILMPKNQQLVAIPADSWYNFNKVPWGNHQLTLEQAEAKIKDFQSSTGGCGKWIKRAEKSGVAAVGEVGVARDNEEDLDTIIQVPDDEVDPVEEGDDWEHEEIFSDDDEQVDMAGSLPDVPEVNQELEVAEENGDQEEGFLSHSGKDMKNLLVAAVKRLKESKEMEVGDSIDETDSLMEEKKSILVSKSNTIKNVASRETTATLSSAVSTARVSVTEEEIRSALLEMGPVTTKDLSNLFSARLMTKEDRKAFTSTVKKIANIQRKVGSKGHVVLKRKRVAM